MVVKSFKSLECKDDFVVISASNKIYRYPMSQCTSEIISLYMKKIEKKFSTNHPDLELTPPNIATSTTSDPDTGDNYIIYTLTYPDADVEDLTIDDYKLSS